ncbi:hypothetical protein BKA70DRAFT_1429206 [Coprinopsis sp. MPI-PUGE-AT-0042]|nr:hypothetical protein BKA70DRAFT_1429206 [Coprinopsis sp. MPI-PUGE-AT-0042]
MSYDLNSPKLIVWNTSTNIDLSLRICTKLLPYSKDSTQALVLALQYFMKYPECQIVSATLTEGSACVGVNWDNEGWRDVIMEESGVRAMNLDLEQKFMAARAQQEQAR